jgi:putative phage-type endonuclease
VAIRKVSVANATREEWLAVRSGTIGGSDAGAVVGLSPWKSAFTLWAEMTGRAKPFEGNLATDVGTYLEEFVAKKFQEATGLQVLRSNFIYFNDDYPNQHATPDRILRQTGQYGLGGLKCGLEIKTTNGFGRFKGGEEGFPEQYYAQCCQYLAVMGYDVWFLAVLVGNREIHFYEMRRDEKLPVPDFVEGNIVADQAEMDALKEACDDFMRKVADDVPPLPDGDERTSKAVDDAFPVASDESTILYGQDENAEKLFQLKQDMKGLKTEIDRLTNIFKADMGEYAEASCGRYIMKWQNVSSTTLDSKKLKEMDPETWKKYSKTNTTRKFTMTMKKEEDQNG